MQGQGKSLAAAYKRAGKTARAIADTGGMSARRHARYAIIPHVARYKIPVGQCRLRFIWAKESNLSTRRTVWSYGTHLSILSRQGPLCESLCQAIIAGGKSPVISFPAPLTTAHPCPQPSAVEAKLAISPSRRLAIFMFANDHPSSTLRFEAKNSVVTSVDGWVTLPADQDLEHFLYTIPDDNGASLIRQLGGVFALYRADLRADRLHVWNTVIGSRAVVYAEGPEFIAIGNSPALVHLASRAMKDHAFDTSAIVSLLISDTVFPGDTPYKNTFVLPQNSYLSATSAGVKVAATDDAIDTFGRTSGEPTSELYDELTHALVESCRCLRGATVYDLGLTGGRDSRLVAGALRAAGVDFVPQVSGFDDYADVIVAKMITERLSLPLTYSRMLDNSATRGEVDVFGSTISYLRETGGMSMTRCILPSKSTTIGASRPTDNVSIDGIGGEVLRGGNYLSISGSYMAGRASIGAEEVWNILESEKSSVPFNKWLLPQYKTLHADRLDAWARSVIGKNKPTNVLERLYAGSFLTRYGFHKFLSPLADNRLIRLSQRVSPEYRFTERIHFEIVQRVAPELVDVPLANHRWAFEQNSPIVGDEQGWLAREPVKDFRPMATNYVYLMAGRELRDELYEIIFRSKGSSVLGSVVDMEEVKRSFRNRDLYHWRYGWSIWNLYSASVLFSGVTLPSVEPTQGRPAIVVDTGAPWPKMTIAVLDASKRSFIEGAPRRFDAQLKRFSKMLESRRAAFKVPETIWSDFLIPIEFDEFNVNGTAVGNVSDLWRLHTADGIKLDNPAPAPNKYRDEVVRAVHRRFLVECGEFPPVAPA
jgi:hypothetical protein